MRKKHPTTKWIPIEDESETSGDDSESETDDQSHSARQSFYDICFMVSVLVLETVLLENCIPHLRAHPCSQLPSFTSFLAHQWNILAHAVRG
jgi:hypothetical protein